MSEQAPGTEPGHDEPTSASPSQPGEAAGTPAHDDAVPREAATAPAESAQDPADDSGNEVFREPEAPRRRVVVAEDEALIRLDIVEILTGRGFDVVAQADNGEDAVSMAQEHRPDVVLMDVKMPRMDGISAAERIATERIAPVVLLTAFSQKELVDRATEAGAMAYVVKPFTENDLIPAIEVAMSRYEQIKALESEVTDLKEQFETRKLVDRAKSLLITKMGLSEPEAFRWIQKTSMDRRLSMREVAETIVSQVS